VVEAQTSDRRLLVVTLAGCLLPIVGLATAVIVDSKPLAFASLFGALVLPALGHVVFRRVHFTRGLKLRLATTVVAVLLVLAMRDQRNDLGGILVLAIMAELATFIGFVIGMAFDVVDATSSGTVRSPAAPEQAP